MNYSQKSLIEIMKQGDVFGEAEKPKHLETAISNLFLFSKNVYKVYKSDNDFFNRNFRDLADKAERFSFTRKDFNWNSTLSPSIYRELKGVSVINDALVIGEPEDDAQELVFLMNRFDSNDILYEKLIRGTVSIEDAYSMGKQVAENLQRVQTENIPGDFFELFKKEIHDVRVWGADVAEHLPMEEWNGYCDFLERFRLENREWCEGELSLEIKVSGDAHSHNLVFSNKVAYLIDSYPPKEEWGIAHMHTVFYRIGTDILVLGSEELFESYRRGYEEARGLSIDRRLDPVFIMYSASIMISYMYMLQKTDLDKKPAALRYHEFVRQYFKKVNVLG